MGGVDPVDQQLHGAHALGKHCKWDRQLVLWSLSIIFFCYMHDIVPHMLSLRPEVPNQSLLVDGNVSRLFARHIASLKLCKPDAKDKRSWKVIFALQMESRL